MKVILRADITSLGQLGDIKEVAEGYARNYLIPRSLVLEATPGNMKLWEREKEKYEKHKEEKKKAARELAEKLEKISLTVPVKVGEGGKVFGSVTNAHIARGLEENGFKVEKHDILLSEPIKEIGAFTVEIRLHPEVNGALKIWVVEEK